MSNIVKVIASKRATTKADGTESVRRQYFVTLPVAIVRAFGWDETTRLEITIEGKGILRMREAKGD